MESHEQDLRSEVGSEEQARAVQDDYRTAGLKPREVALLDYAVKLTRSPASDLVRSHGEAYEAYRRQAGMLFPVPRKVEFKE